MCVSTIAGMPSVFLEKPKGSDREADGFFAYEGLVSANLRIPRGPDWEQFVEEVVISFSHPEFDTVEKISDSSEVRTSLHDARVRQWNKSSHQDGAAHFPKHQDTTSVALNRPPQLTNLLIFPGGCPCGLSTRRHSAVGDRCEHDTVPGLLALQRHGHISEHHEPHLLRFNLCFEQQDLKI